MQVFYMFLFLSVKMVVGDLTATSTHEMGRVLEGEDHLLADFRIYIKVVQDKVNEIRTIVNDAMKRQAEAMIDPEAFVSNPLNSLPMLRRMQQDAGKLYSYLLMEEGKDLQQIADYRLDVLTDMDLEHGAKGLLRIQEVYNLDERDMAKGLLTQKQYKHKMSTLDCVCLARYLLKQGEDQQAVKWFEIALEQYKDTPEPVLKLMNTERAVILKELGMIQLKRDNFLGMWETFNQAFKYAEREELRQEAEAYMELAAQSLSHISNCRGQSRLPVSSSIGCNYNSNNSPYLRLAPFKQEQLSIDPHIVLYHDVISNEEISHILNLTKSNLSRALVGKSGLRRSAMNAFLTQNASLFIERVHRRIKDMSGLEFLSNTDLDVINYGIGGQYNLHYDCAFNLHEASLGNNRFATVLLYLSDVQLGGLTSFPLLNLGVQPMKGSALMWHNVNSAAECDKRMLYAACPVLLGNRWVAAQWFEMAKQKTLVCSDKTI